MVEHLNTMMQVSDHNLAELSTLLRDRRRRPDRTHGISRRVRACATTPTPPRS
jgi:hypothetical protein